MYSYADYYPFGEKLPTRDNITGNYRYAYQGQELDGGTGMEAFQLRLCNGKLGRWLSPDSYGQFFSPYVGMGNNPIGMIDADGGETNDWYLPKGETDQGKAVWIYRSGPQKGFDWLGGNDFIFDGTSLNEVTIRGQTKPYFLDGYFKQYQRDPDPNIFHLIFHQGKVLLSLGHWTKISQHITQV